MCSPLIEFQNVTVARDGRRLLDAISLTIREGEHAAILGPNGAGKTSLVRAIMREYYPSSPGRDVTFRFRGRDRWDAFDLRSHIGIVSSDLQQTFARPISGREVVLSGFFSSIGLFTHDVTPDMEEKADRILAFLGVVHLADRPMTAVSSGEARRLLIGRALVHDPETLLLDEPAAGSSRSRCMWWRPAVTIMRRDIRVENGVFGSIGCFSGLILVYYRFSAVNSDKVVL